MPKQYHMLRTIFSIAAMSRGARYIDLENIYLYIVSFILMFPLSVVLPELHSCSRFTSFSSQLKGAIAMSSMLIIIAIIELVVNILAAVVCGKVICCRKRPVSQVSSLMLGLIENNNKIHLI